MCLSIPLAKVGERIATLPEELLQEAKLGVVAVTRDGQPVLAILPWELYAVMLETLDRNEGMQPKDR